MLIDVKQLSELLNVSRKTIFNYVKTGMPVIRMSPRKLRFDYDEVVQWFRHKGE